MRTIQVKDSDRYGDHCSIFNKVKVYVGETKAEHDRQRKEEYDSYILNRDNDYSDFNEHNYSEREEVDLA